MHTNLIGALFAAHTEVKNFIFRVQWRVQTQLRTSHDKSSKSELLILNVVLEIKSLIVLLKSFAQRVAQMVNFT